METVLLTVRSSLNHLRFGTIKFSPKTQDGKFIGRSQEAYDKFVEFIKLTNEQSKTGKELSEAIYLPFLFESAKIEVQGTNPDNIKAGFIPDRI